MDFIWYRMNWNLLAPETERMWHSLEKKKTECLFYNGKQAY